MKLELPAQCLLPDAQTLSQVLLGALKSGEAIEVDGHAVTRIGTAALQLLWLARRDVIDQAHEWRWLSASAAPRGPSTVHDRRSGFAQRRGFRQLSWSPSCRTFLP